MTATEKRKAVVNKIKSRERKNTYSQGSNRTQVGSGYGDCSSTTRWAYLEAINVDIGINTEAQIKSNKSVKVPLKITKGIPNEKDMLEGDLLYFRGHDASRTKGVGHVEMYIGNGNIIGHGSGIGPTIKNMKSYCEQRQRSASRAVSLPNRGLICVKRVIPEDVKKPMPDTLLEPITKMPDIKGYSGFSVIDALNSIKHSSSFASRKKLYVLAGFKDIYKGTETQNLNLLAKLREVKKNPYESMLKGYSGTSIIDAFTKAGLNSSLSNRKKIAKEIGITQYTGKAYENIALLKALGATVK